jgi:glycosyltransferase involved in cell wall biosynthesis
MTEISFTVFIPTYERPQALRRTVTALLPQLGDQVRLHIIDNHSPTPVTEVLADLLDERIRVLRNRVNIGGNANLMRCFETCETEWMWMPGDDDFPDSDAIQTILTAISEADEKTTYLNFSGKGLVSHPGTIRIQSYDAMLEACSDRAVVSNVLFISVSVYRVSRLRRYLKYGFQNTSTCAPKMILVFISLIDG